MTTPTRARAVPLIRDAPKAFLLTNLLIYGIFLAGMALGVLFPELHAARAAPVAAPDGWVSTLVTAVAGNVWLFAATILTVNVVTVGLALISLPSAIVPFAGYVLMSLKALDLGIVLSPVSDTERLILIPHSLTLLIEFQAYIVILFGTYLHSRAWVRPATVGATTRRAGYLHGLRALGRLWVPGLVLLVIGAIYEAFSILHLVPLVLEGLR